MSSTCRLRFVPTRTTSVHGSAWLGVLRKNGLCAAALDFSMIGCRWRFLIARSKRTVCKRSSRLLPIQMRSVFSQLPGVAALLLLLLELLGRSFFGPGRVDPHVDAIYQLEDTATSTYNGLTLALNKRMSNEVELLTSYTLSKTRDDASDFDEQPQNPFDLRSERALSRQDVR